MRKSWIQGLEGGLSIGQLGTYETEYALCLRKNKHNSNANFV